MGTVSPFTDVERKGVRQITSYPQPTLPSSFSPLLAFWNIPSLPWRAAQLWRMETPSRIGLGVQSIESLKNGQFTHIDAKKIEGDR